jgi:outer membrane lipoprotein LolB
VKHIILLVLATVLAGCAELQLLTPAQQTDTGAWELHQAALASLQRWSITGRIAIQTEQEGWNATLHWDQDNENYTLRLISPLGQGTYQLHGNDHLVSLLTAENKIYQADNPEILLQQNLGWSVPVGGLKHWIKGIPEPGVNVENIFVDGDGRMTDLQQSGWRISIIRYADFDGTQLPSKLFMQNNRLKLRIVIQDWKTKT